MKRAVFKIPNLIACLWLIHLPVSSLPMQSGSEADYDELACKIEIPETFTIVDGHIMVNVVISNVSNSNVLISTLCGGGKGRWKGGYRISLMPDFWVSEYPRPERIREKIMLLQPGDSYRVPLSIPWESEWLDEDRSLTVEASYSVGKGYGELYRVWHGHIHAQPVKIQDQKRVS